jgi:hypothetical protein
MLTPILSRRGLCLALLLSFVAAARAQAPAPASLTVTGDIPQSFRLTPADLAAMPRASATTNNDGIATVYEGVLLSEVLKKAGVPLGPALRGPALASYILASASDGYQVVFSLGELDPEMTETQILLADKANGIALSGPNGSFRLVLPKDKAGARSIRQLAKLEVVRLRK